MSSLHSTNPSPKPPHGCWKKKFTGTSTRSSTRSQAWEYGDSHNFLSMPDTPSPRRKRTCSEAFSAANVQARKKNETTDLTNYEEETARRKIAVSLHIANLTFQGPGIPQAMRDGQHASLVFSAGRLLQEPDGDIYNSQNLGTNHVQRRVDLLSLPVELHQRVAGFLDSDAAIAALTQVCKTLSSNMSASVWRERAKLKFDPMKGAVALEEIPKEYRARQMMLKTYVSFRGRATQEHRTSLKRLRDLILQSDARTCVHGGVEKVTGLNLDFLKRYIVAARPENRRPQGSDILEVICNYQFNVNYLKSLGLKGQVFSRSVHSLVALIQLSLSHLVFDPKVCVTRAHRAVESQQTVYQSRELQPIFRGIKTVEINVSWLSHAASFFKLHLKEINGEGVLAHAYESLAEDERPRPWTGKLNSGTKTLDKHWKGAFTYLHHDDMEDLQRDLTEDRILVDEIGQMNSGFLDLTLFFDIQEYKELCVPDRFEHFFRTKPASPKNDLLSDMNSTPEVKDFFGLGFNGKEYHLNGRVHALPLQQGIPGFQRVTMMSYLPNGSTSHTAWAWEACVLPGSQIMLGRWWDPQDAEYCGPCIFWRSKGRHEDQKKDVNAALAFLEKIEWSTI